MGTFLYWAFVIFTGFYVLPVLCALIYNLAMTPRAARPAPQPKAPSKLRQGLANFAIRALGAVLMLVIFMVVMK